MRRTVRGAGRLLVILGVVVLLYAAYEIWGATARVDAQQDQLTRQLEQQWQRDPSSAVVGPTGPGAAQSGQPQPALGTGIAILSIPKLNMRWPVVEGVGAPQLRHAPGHYPNTAMPGTEGNFAVAGHRTRAVFWDLDRLAPGDEIIVATGEGRYLYHVTNVVIVAPNDVAVVGPVPPGEHAGRLLTLTTCNPKFNNYQRLIVHASMDADRHSGTRPAE